MKGLIDLSERSKSDRVKKAVHDIVDALAESAESDRFRRYLEFAARIPGRSEMNRLLLAISLMNRDAVPTGRLPYFLGFKSWGRYGRRVKKGERGHFILAPVRRNVPRPTDDDEDNTIPVVVGFKAAWVFELAQTEPDCRGDDGKPQTPCGVCAVCERKFAPPEDFFRPLVGTDPSGVFEALKAMAESRGFPVRIGDTTEVAGRYVHGVTRFAADDTEREIVIDEGASGRMRTATLAHELAHVVLHDPFDARQPPPSDLAVSKHHDLDEVEAEALAYLLLSAVGFADDDLRTATGDYTAAWTRGNPDVLMRALSRVLKVYGELEDELAETYQRTQHPVLV